MTNINVFQTPELPRQIAWEKWRDPLGGDFEASEWPGAVGNFETDKFLDKTKLQTTMIEKNDNDQEWNEDHYDKEPSHFIGPMAAYRNQKHIPFMATRFGIIPITEHTRAGDIFNFWVAHTNFRLTQQIVEIIDNTNGVESFDIYTPYRWRIAIGKAFDSQQVKVWVAQNLNAQPLAR